MSAKKALTKEDVFHLASLASLKLTNEEIESYRKQLSDVISHIEKLNEVDTVNIQPKIHATEAKNVFFEDDQEPSRTLPNLKNLNITEINKQQYFVVKKIM